MIILSGSIEQVKLQLNGLIAYYGNAFIKDVIFNERSI